MGLISPGSGVRVPPGASNLFARALILPLARFPLLLFRLASRQQALVAQLVEHGSNKPRVGGSSPSWSMNGWMAERSKALVSGTSLFGGVGSNPTPVTFGCVAFVLFATHKQTFDEIKK